ncbi:MAG: 50S ribosomal protein L30 [Candidatus Diapherotrites archaeon]|uniref:Large ribosomal subunit protein uL30 n=1 Tax=Candidatus Iainarchaeum sp. TaxID=3101447 RepID=A0A8T4L442_9ARCH|nr:50S ribosomal protein L30 [Candidatus Diapherotrites archaeon]
MLAVVRIKGEVHTPYDVRDTMKMLRLERINHMIVLSDSPVNHGMLKKVEHLITYGPVDAQTFSRVLEKRGKLSGDKKLDAEFLKTHKAKNLDEVAEWVLSQKKSLKDLGVKPVFRLHPPKKGFGRTGVKTGFSMGGGSGDRKEKINDLIKRMS